MRELDVLNPEGKRVIVRVDWNVTIGKAMQIVDDTRIKRTIPTIEYLLKHGAKQLVLLSHLGKTEEKKSLEALVEYAQELVGELIVFHKSIEQCKNDKQSKIMMLENVRIWEGEDKNDLKFANDLAGLGDVYVNEAFGECHRKSASIVGIPRYVPGYAGLNLVNEVVTLMKVANEPKRPFVVVMGGAKVDDRVALMGVLSEKADVILLGGKLANEFVRRDVKLSGKARLVLPVEGSDLLDIGLETRRLYEEEIARAGTVLWSGPMGKVEEEEFQGGTHAVYEAISKNEKAYTVVGGGDTLASIKEEQHLERIDFVSTGGGAMLELVEKGTLPGIEALEKK